MKKAFTLLELLVVVGIMGLLGATATGGYRAMVRAMEERGVMQNVNSFVRAAYQRAQIDRQPTVVYFWNETVRSRTADEVEVVVGKAVAVRRSGRVSRKDGSVLIDEFADLNMAYKSLSEEDENGGGGGSDGTSMRIYALDRANDTGIRYSLIRPDVVLREENVQFLGGVKTDANGGGSGIPGYGFVLEKENGVTWKQGMPYGFEFLRLELPAGFVFGTSHSSDAGNPVTDAGKLTFDVGRNDNSGRNTGGVVGGGTIAVSALRMQGTTLNAVKIGDSDRPDREVR